MISSIVPVVPKNTSGARDFFFIPTGIAIRAPATEKNHVPNALLTVCCAKKDQLPDVQHHYIACTQYISEQKQGENREGEESERKMRNKAHFLIVKLHSQQLCTVVGI